MEVPAKEYKTSLAHSNSSANITYTLLPNITYLLGEKSKAAKREIPFNENKKITYICVWL